ncbi:hypothetical protein BV25DRAFT_756687 [Artomyces pyxidatus]|uniref:Uncharacterized protein n=1 Tax=Artomyces pyxidatus TaxID=48021 RepID=A0ACB8SZT8_9AGAM|nr:hypothetical protein BV25DRAFT_756687 [Artomyces pyxidatus]
MASMYRFLRELSGATSLSSTNSELDKYSALWNEFWGSDDAQARHFQTCTIQRDGTLPDLDVPSEVAILHAASVSSLHVGQGPILIRPEFVEALKALLQFAEDNPSSIPCVFYDILEDQEAIPACSGAWPSAQDENPFLAHNDEPAHSVRPAGLAGHRQNALANLCFMSSAPSQKGHHIPGHSGRRNRF